MNAEEDIHGVLEKHWGYTSFRPCQEEIIRSVLSGRDTLGLLPTGGGKSLTFQVPALLLDGLTLVVTPLVSLMKDQVDRLAAAGVSARALHAGLTAREARLTYDKCRLGKTRLLYVAPERLASPAFLAELRTWRVALAVVDEAHCVSQWGYDFRPAYMLIAGVRRDCFPGAPILALTASATPSVLADIVDKLGMRDPAVFRRSFSRDNISFVVRESEDKAGTLLKVLRGTTGSAIVYARSRARTSEYAQILVQAGISADFYHAGLMAQEKNEKQNRWRDGRLRVLVATTAFGMGIDKPDVRVVAHVDIPSSLEEYYQEAGRAGRDGKPAYAVLIARKADKAALARRVAEAFPPKEFLRKIYDEVGVYLDLAMGEGGGQTFPFDLEGFCRRFKHQILPTSSALALLTRTGCIEYTGEMSTMSRLMVVMPRSELYGLGLEAAQEEIFTFILRYYSGLYADYVPINEETVAEHTGRSEKEVYETLVALRSRGVIQFVPKRVSPYIFYPTRREPGNEIVIPRSVYDERRESMKERVGRMCEYVFGEGACRVQTMLGYFGQETGECGKCDKCRARAAEARAAGRRAEVAEGVRHIASLPGGRDLAYFTEQLCRDGSEAERALVTRVMRSMLDGGEIRRLADGRFIWTGK